MTNYTSSNQKSYLSYIAANPGCCTADVNRACKRNSNAGHKWVYDGVSRLIKRGFVSRTACTTSSNGQATGLRLTTRALTLLGLVDPDAHCAEHGCPRATCGH